VFFGALTRCPLYLFFARSAPLRSAASLKKSLVTNSLGYLSQHLAVLLDPEDLTENMHTAYKRVDFPHSHYGCFVMGPSATADISAVLVHGAQGARTLTLFFLKKPVP
jgi:L-lactate dehydrogenase complex protein LldG